MRNLIKRRVISFLICGSMAGVGMADDSPMNNNATPTSNEAVAAQQNLQTQKVVPVSVNNESGQATNQDEMIAKNVKTALAGYTDNLDVMVKNNIVFLMGKLASDTDYEKVITVSESIKGVKDVNVDNLSVKNSDTPLMDIYLTAKVKGALIREEIMGKDIPSWTVNVETKNGIVYLSGNMATDEEIQKVIEVVKRVGGVSRVENKLVVGSSQASTIN